MNETFETRKKLIVPILIIALGASWLLNVLELLPAVDWVWTVGLVVIGVLTLSIGGPNKLSIVIGPLFIIAAICSLLRQLDVLTIKHEIPILTIVLGVLLLIAQLTHLPMPEMFEKEHEDRNAGADDDGK